PGWPTHLLGQPLFRLPDTTMDRRRAAAAPGPLARFAVVDGSELLLRWIDQADRAVHPPEDCYRGNGYRVTSRTPLSAPVSRPSVSLEASIQRGAIWRRFWAERSGEAWE